NPKNILYASLKGQNLSVAQHRSHLSFFALARGGPRCRDNATIRISHTGWPYAPRADPPRLADRMRFAVIVQPPCIRGLHHDLITVELLQKSNALVIRVREVPRYQRKGKPIRL
ncbi:MAG: hypothetical protein AAFR79_01565, partial [Pseudomonadota bacterium]